MLKLKLQYFGHLMWRAYFTFSYNGKDPDAGKDWRQEKKGTTEEEMVGWHHRLNGHEFEQAPGVGDGQGSLECCSSWGCKELDMTEQLNCSVKALKNTWNLFGLCFFLLLSNNTGMWNLFATEFLKIWFQKMDKFNCSFWLSRSLNYWRP